MPIRVVRLGTKRATREGLRLGTVRRPPRGVTRTRFAKDDWYDLWLPDLAPSEATVKQALRATAEKDWRAFARKYRGEMAAPEKQRLLQLLAMLSQSMDFAVGCYCADESRCHRSVLRELLRQRGARIAG